jgi:phage terminase large subunit GpA-like protein
MSTEALFADEELPELQDSDELLASIGLNDEETDLFARIMRFWAPKEDISYVDWAEKNYQLEEGSLYFMPFQKGPLDALYQSDVDQVTLLKSARVGYTMSISIVMAYHVAQDPCKMLVYQYTDEAAKGFMTDTVKPALDRTPQTRAIMNGPLDRDTIQNVIFPGGLIKCLSAGTPSSFRRHDGDLIICDEVSKWEITTEGDPIALASRRGQNSPRKKMFLGSTPAKKETCLIWKSYQEGDQRKRFVPFPCCGVLDTLEWEHMWVDGKPIKQYKKGDLPRHNFTVVQKCRNCDGHMEESYKKHADENGEWIAQAEFHGHASFHINALYSTFPGAAWPILVKEYGDAIGDPAVMETFVNTVLGMPFSSTQDSADPDVIKERVEKFGMELIPEDVLLMTAGVDIQKDRAEVTYLGWSRYQSYILGHRVIYGDPTGHQLWDRIDGALELEFQHALGGQIGVAAAGVDSGNWTQRVYEYTAGKQMRGFYAIKGVQKGVIWAESKIRPGQGGKLYNIGTDASKEVLLQWLAIDDTSQDGYIHFSDLLTFEYFKQLCAEERVVEIKKNVPVYSFARKKNTRAEALDCWVYGHAVRNTLVPNWDRLRDELTEDPSKEKPKSSGWGDLGKKAGSMSS